MTTTNAHKALRAYRRTLPPDDCLADAYAQSWIVQYTVESDGQFRDEAERIVADLRARREDVSYLRLCADCGTVCVDPASGIAIADGMESHDVGGYRASRWPAPAHHVCAECAASYADE